MKKTYIWICDYCGEEFNTKKKSDNHEKNCVENPQIKKSIAFFSKPVKTSGLIWIISVILFFITALLSANIPLFSLEKSPVLSIIFGGFVVIGVIAFLIMVISIALNLSFGHHPTDSMLKRIFRFIFSLVFLPIVVMRNLVGVFLGFFVLLPVWGLGLVFLLIISGVITTNTPVIGNSMYPTIHDQETISLNSYTFFQKVFNPPQNGDIITFSSGRTASSSGELSSYIKRVVAVGGDEVSIRDGFLYLNNQLVKESYTAKPRSTFGGSFLPECKSIKVPKDYVFVLGDNRKRSKDSREIGLVSLNEIQSIMPINKQTKFKDRARDASNDGVDQGLPSFGLDEYYEKINKIRTDNKLKPLNRNEKLENAALARATSIIGNNEVNKIGNGDNGKYPYDKAIRDSGYSNITTGEIRTTGYYDAEELRGASLISFAKAKIDSAYGASFSIKNLFGLIPDPNRYEKIPRW